MNYLVNFQPLQPAFSGQFSSGVNIFGSLKQERCQWRHYQTRYEAQKDILQYIAVFYNNQRLHSYLDYKSPIQYEAEAAKSMKAA